MHMLIGSFEGHLWLLLGSIWGHLVLKVPKEKVLGSHFDDIVGVGGNRENRCFM